MGREGEQAATQWYAEQLREVGGDDVPSLINNREPQPTWHTRYDVPEDLAPQVMRSGVHYYAEILYRLCNEPELPFERATDDTAKNASRIRLERDVRTKLKTK